MTPLIPITCIALFFFWFRAWYKTRANAYLIACVVFIAVATVSLLYPYKDVPVAVKDDHELIFKFSDDPSTRGVEFSVDTLEVADPIDSVLNADTSLVNHSRIPEK